MMKADELVKHPNIKDPDPDEHPYLKQYKVLFLDYKLNRKGEYYCGFALLFRAIEYDLIIALIPGSPTVQLFFMGASNILMMSYVIKLFPFKLLIKNIEVILYESLLLLVNILVFMIARINNSSDPIVISFGNAVFWLEFMIKIVTLVFTGIEIGITAYYAIKKILAKKKLEKIHPATSPESKHMLQPDGEPESNLPENNNGELDNLEAPIIKTHKSMPNKIKLDLGEAQQTRRTLTENRALNLDSNDPSC
jgi:hypothetical protein